MLCVTIVIVYSLFRSAIGSSIFPVEIGSGAEAEPPSRIWWHQFVPPIAGHTLKRRFEGRRSSPLRWHLNQVFLKMNGERHCLWRAFDHEGEMPEIIMTTSRDKTIA
jgi:hypothetical protein